MDVIRVFTDGSSSKNGKQDCFSGCGVYITNTEEKISMNSEEACAFCDIELEGHSNNIGELLGILVALVSIKDKTKDIIINTDSMYCLNSLSIWWPSWSQRGWITAGGTPVKNKNLIQRILLEKGRFKNVFFKHTRGHTTEPKDKDSEEWKNWYGNDQADKLATKSVHG